MFVLMLMLMLIYFYADINLSLCLCSSENQLSPLLLVLAPVMASKSLNSIRSNPKSSLLAAPSYGSLSTAFKIDSREVSSLNVLVVCVYWLYDATATFVFFFEMSKCFTRSATNFFPILNWSIVMLPETSMRITMSILLWHTNCSFFASETVCDKMDASVDNRWI